MIKLRITPGGCIHGLWNDEVRFSDLGRVRVERVSHVEFDEHSQQWVVREAQPTSRLRRLLERLTHRPAGRILRSATTRTEALAWEHDYFQPGHPGWNDLRK